MKKILALALAGVFAGTLAAQAGEPGTTEPANPAASEAAKAESPKPAETKAAEDKAPQKRSLTENEKVLYALGAALARNLSHFDITPAELVVVTMGLRDGLSGRKPQVDMSTYFPKIGELERSRAEARAAKDAAKAVGEKQKSAAFLAEAAKEKGAVKSLSGLVYTDVTIGTGASPKETDTVKVHYRGTLINGTEFDSSYKRNAPIDFPLNRVIPCWTEGLQKMKVGGKAKLVCPPDIAYGDAGSPPAVPGGAALIFEVELLDIVK